MLGGASPGHSQSSVCRRRWLGDRSSDQLNRGGRGGRGDGVAGRGLGRGGGGVVRGASGLGLLD